MKTILLTMIVSASLLLSGCTAIGVSLTPKETKKAIAQAAAVSQMAVEDPPAGEDLTKFLRANAECWRALCLFYGLEVPEEK